MGSRLSNHELAKRYINKQKLLGVEQLELKLIKDDGVVLLSISDDSSGYIKIPKFITKYGLDVTFRGTYYSDIVIESKAKPNLTYIFNGILADKVNITFNNLKIVTNTINSMFYDCENAKYISINGLNIYGNGINIDLVYKGCSNLEVVDMGYISGSISSMVGVFMGCKNLREITGLSGLNVSRVTNITDLYSGCESIEKIDRLDIKSLESCSRVFKGCKRLKHIALDNIDMSKVTWMLEMYSGSGIRYADISRYNVKDIEEIGGLFNGCKELEVIDIHNIDLRIMKRLRAEQGLYAIVNGCTKLRKIILSKSIAGADEDAYIRFIIELAQLDKRIEIVYK